MPKLPVLPGYVKYLAMATVGLAVATSVLMTVYYRGELKTSQGKLQETTRELVKAESTIDLLVLNAERNEAELKDLRNRKGNIDESTKRRQGELSAARKGSDIPNPPVHPTIASGLRSAVSEVRASAIGTPK